MSEMVNNEVEQPRAREPFPRDANGLVDLAAYDEFLIDDPSIVPLDIRGNEKRDWVHQHIYFSATFYEQKTEPSPMRDRALARFRAVPYNQIIMRPEQEELLHKYFETNISPPDPAIINQSLAEMGHLDSLGGAALGRRVALVPESLPELIPGHHTPKPNPDFSPLKIAEFLDQKTYQAIEALASSTITPQRVVTGAISRLAKLFNNPILLEEAERRQQEDPIFYPVRIPTTGYFYHVNRKLLKQMCEISEAKEEEPLRLVA